MCENQNEILQIFSPNCVRQKSLSYVSVTKMIWYTMFRNNFWNCIPFFSPLLFEESFMKFDKIWNTYLKHRDMYENQNAILQSFWSNCMIQKKYQQSSPLFLLSKENKQKPVSKRVHIQLLLSYKGWTGTESQIWWP